MRLRFGQPPELDLLLEGRTLSIRDHRVLRAIILAEQPIDAGLLAGRLNADSQEVPAQGEQLVRELIAAQALVPADYRHPLQDAAEHWERRGWLEALVLHLQSRDLRYSDFGTGTFVANARPVTRSSCQQGMEHPRAMSPGLALPPPDPHWTTRADLLEVMYARRSGAPWTKGSIDIRLLGNLLAAGNHDSVQNRRASRVSADEAALYDASSYSALETYVVCNRVDGIPPGVYHYALETHELVPVREGDFQQDLATLCIGQAKVKGCAAAFLIGAVWARYFRLYRHARAYRNLLINTAELAHGYILAATAASLSNFITPAFNDEEAERLLGASNVEVGPLYLVAVG
jgi:SagB-type dehydrogenase family enzyme